MPESGMHMTEMMTYDWPMITVYAFMRFLLKFNHKMRFRHLCHFQQRHFSTRNFHFTCIWYKKMAP